MFLFVLLFAFAMLAVCFPALWIRRKDFGLSSSFLRTGEKEGGEKNHESNYYQFVLSLMCNISILTVNKLLLKLFFSFFLSVSLRLCPLVTRRKKTGTFDFKLTSLHTV